MERAREESISLVVEANDAFDRAELEELVPLAGEEDSGSDAEGDGGMPPPEGEDVPLIGPPPIWPLPEEQKGVYNAIMDAVRLPEDQVVAHRGFAVMAPAG